MNNNNTNNNGNDLLQKEAAQRNKLREMETREREWEKESERDWIRERIRVKGNAGRRHGTARHNCCCKWFAIFKEC